MTIQKGDNVMLVRPEMPGEIVQVKDGFYQVKWKSGYESPFSGRTFWHQGIAFSLGVIAVENSVVPEPMKELPAPDLFENAFQLAFEI